MSLNRFLGTRKKLLILWKVCAPVLEKEKSLGMKTNGLLISPPPNACKSHSDKI